MTTKEKVSLTFLFTDIEGSTRLFQADSEGMREAQVLHDVIICQAVEGNHGRVFRTIGDSICAVFESPSNALNAAIIAQQGLQKEPWKPDMVIKTRMAMDCGEVEELENDFYGRAPIVCARVLSTGHGGQVLVSNAVAILLEGVLPPGISLRDMGERRLKDLLQPERIFQVLHPDLPAEFPPLRALDSRPNNLPPPPNTLIGREKELFDILRLLRQLDLRLLSLTGPGGTGKTRLALRAGDALLDDFEHGVFFVALASITDPARIPLEIAKAVGVEETAGRTIADELNGFLRDKSLLLIMDNFEHLMAAVPSVSNLMRGAPKVKILTTSREKLGLYNEHEYGVEPLAIPDPETPPTPDRVLSYPATSMFVERARAASSEFAVTPGNAGSISRICALLDGLPLAIELAAAHCDVLIPRQIEEQLSSRLMSLKGGPSDFTERQQSLRGALDWSYDLLSAAEKSLLSQFSVFVGGCTLDAALEVCTLPDATKDELRDTLFSLVRKSLVRRRLVHTGEPRLSMLNLIREYANVKLAESGLLDAAGCLHAEYYNSLAEKSSRLLSGPEQLEWLTRLDFEVANFRAALDWAVSNDPQLGLSLASRLGRYWVLRGPWEEAYGWFVHFLESDPSGRGTLRSDLFHWAGTIACHRGENLDAINLLETALTLRRQDGNQLDISATLNSLGMTYSHTGDYDKARKCYTEALGIDKTTGNLEWQAEALNNLGVIAMEQEDYTAAKDYYEHALALARLTGDKTSIAMALNNLGISAECLRDYELACKRFEESLVVALEIENKKGIAYLSCNLGSVYNKLANHERSKSHMRKGVTNFFELGDKRGIAGAFEECVKLETTRSRAAVAAKLLGAAEAIRESIGAPLSPREIHDLEPTVNKLRTQMGEAAFEAARADGRKMAMEQALDFALKILTTDEVG